MAQQTKPQAYTILVALIAVAPVLVQAQNSAAVTDTSTVELAPQSVNSYWVANEAPASTFAAPVTLLRYLPQVDLQTRGIAEGQADIALRGGVFENTGVKLGGLPLYDPQTGHYSAELPLDPALLEVPQVKVGTDQAASGFNSTTGSIVYRIRPLTDSGAVEAGFGEHSLNYQRGFATMTTEAGFLGGRTVGAAVSAARSEGDGAQPYGDHEFKRISGLVQVRGTESQTDLLLGYASKSYAWPGMYTGNATFKELDDYQTLLLAANHRWDYAPDSHLAFAAGYRRLKDDYELNTLRGKDWFRAYRHETETVTGAIDGRHAFELWAVNYNLTALADQLDSTDLRYGNFMSRTYWKAAIVPEVPYAINDTWTAVAKAGLAYDDTNRNSDDFSPLAGLSLVQKVSEGSNRYFVEYSRTTQVAGYTALNSPPPPGAFAGNKQLDRAAANTYETGAEITRKIWSARSAVFFRQDHNLADWTFNSAAPGTRQANPVDLETWGIETSAQAEVTSWARLIVGYTYLDKTSDYGSALVNGSYYALNFARHRFTTAAVLRPIEWLELRVDAEYREQEPNVKRTTGAEAFTTSAGISFFPPWVKGLELGATGDNLTDSNFQEFPGTPGERRQISFWARYRW
ncbi:MAG: TonB-dependent receptor [Verrucomicrobiota bacterium]|nr:TonB-dependent receptor [Verrucomicrobiota bacterium]